jgi:hypothetical protein
MGKYVDQIERGLKTTATELSGKAGKQRAKLTKEDQERREATAEKKREARGVEPKGKDFDEMATSARGYKSPTTGEYKKGGWIKEAIKKPGALREQLGIKGKKPIPAKMLDKATKAPGKLGQRARLAKTLKGMK